MDAERGAEAGTFRRVQIFTPPSPTIHISIDSPTPLQAGLNRDYNVSRVVTDGSIQFHLQPHQKIYGMVAQGDGMGHPTILIEYLEGAD